MRQMHIFGAGIGGLSIAHLLAKKYPDAIITLYEKNNIIGGQARSTRDNNGKFQEYCWHAFGSAYNNLFSLLRNAKLFDRLVPVKQYLYDSEKLDLFVEKKQKFFKL